MFAFLLPMTIALTSLGECHQETDGPAASPAPAAISSVSADAANAAYQRFVKLTGQWEGKSTKGWTDRGTFRVIAGGSVVMGTTFDAHPGETMVTMYHMDGDRLMLTHYCAAKNQPRMVARSISEDGNEVTFEFLDGTNLPSRDKGHMDKAVYKFVDDDRFTTRWTWYQDGKESWMEEVEYRRAAAPPAGDEKPGGKSDDGK